MPNSRGRVQDWEYLGPLARDLSTLQDIHTVHTGYDEILDQTRRDVKTLEFYSDRPGLDGGQNDRNAVRPSHWAERGDGVRGGIVVYMKSKRICATA